jgi:hypothetical protein
VLVQGATRAQLLNNVRLLLILYKTQ